MLLGLLAAVDAVPDLGVIYAASGRLHVLMATESARRPEVAPRPHPHADGRRPRDLREAARRPEVVVLRRRHAGRAPRGAALAAPREVHVFRVGVPEAARRRAEPHPEDRGHRRGALQAQRLPGRGHGAVLRPRDALHAAPGDGAARLAGPVRRPLHPGARVGPPGAGAPRVLGARAGLGRVERGRDLLAADARKTARLFHRWLASYCRGGDDLAHFNGGDQHILSREVLSAVQRDRLLVYHLLPIWNYRRSPGGATFERGRVLLVGVGLGGAQAPAHLHRPRRAEAARLRRAGPRCRVLRVCVCVCVCVCRSSPSSGWAARRSRGGDTRATPPDPRVGLPELVGFTPI